MAGQPLFSRQSGFGPLVQMLTWAEGEATVARLARQEAVALVGIPGQKPLPFATMSRVFERAAHLVGDELFGLGVGKGMRPEDFGPFVTFAHCAPTVERSIARTMVLARLQTSAVSTSLAVHRETALWSLNYRRGAGQYRQHALHVLPSMISSIRAFCGGEMSGLRIEVPFASRRMAAGMEDALGVPVCLGAATYGIAFPRFWLMQRRSASLAPPLITLSDVYRYYFPDLPRTTAAAVRTVLPSLLANGRTQLDEVARVLGMSRRKMQSDLNGEGQLFRDVLREARTTRAMELMRQSEATLAQIALMVGYSDQAHFHRAFLAITGMAPGQWRTLLRSTDRLPW